MVYFRLDAFGQARPSVTGKRRLLPLSIPLLRAQDPGAEQSLRVHNLRWADRDDRATESGGLEGRALEKRGFDSPEAAVGGTYHHDGQKPDDDAEVKRPLS